ncbi:hypothetical protein R1sor_013954 [Riccia sorocarpa]|uniref:Uncharacterized protein n=1 Tax=Riccia sorocarpa TaxID=122646 RepID=A0ABD3H820_9MARC
MRVHAALPDSSPVTPGCVGMTQGGGDNSYAQNSKVQRKLTDSVLPLFFEAIRSMRLPESDEVFRIIDMGCSSGPNTVTNVEAIIEQVQARYREQGSKMPEVQVFFQDLPDNDFNTLFKYLSSETKNSRIAKALNYKAAAVAGSFCDCLFPKANINIALSTLALHWLSKIPDAVLDKQSPAYNCGQTDLHCARLATVQAFSEQAERELDSFLAARAYEVVSGGLVFLTFMIQQGDFYPYRLDPLVHAQDEVWNQLVAEGAVSEELRDAYNLPSYFRTLGEVKKQLEKYSSVFQVEKYEVIPQKYDRMLDGYSNLRQSARAQVLFTQGLCESLHESYFGKSTTDLFYTRLEEAYYDLFSGWKSGAVKPEQLSSLGMLVLTLRRITVC